MTRSPSLINRGTWTVAPLSRTAGLVPPAAVILTVTHAEPGVKGDRVSGATKPVTLETGLVVQVPLFVTTGDRVKVDTRTGAYIERVK